MASTSDADIRRRVPTLSRHRFEPSAVVPATSRCPFVVRNDRRCTDEQRDGRGDRQRDQAASTQQRRQGDQNLQNANQGEYHGGKLQGRD